MYSIHRIIILTITMNTNIRFLTVALLAVLLAACGSSRRTTINGYDDATLNGHRIFVVTPLPDQVTMTNPDQFAAARGVAGATAREMLQSEFRTMLIPALNQQMDSNTTFNYSDEPVGSMVALNATNDFNNAGPINWEKVSQAAREGNIDYMIVVRNLEITNTTGGPSGRGDEAVSGRFILLDARNNKVMTSGEFDIAVEDPRKLETTWQMVATELSKRMPFWVGE